MRLNSQRRDGLDVALGEIDEEPFLARPPDVVAGVALAFVEDPEVDPGVVQDAGERLGDADVARVERGEVADEPEDSTGSLRASLTSNSSSFAQRPRLRFGSPNELPDS